MVARSLNEIGLRCPRCRRRLVSRGSQEYRCAEAEGCGGLFRFGLNSVEGITLTLKEEPIQTQRTDALKPAEPARHQASHLSLVQPRGAA